MKQNGANVVCLHHQAAERGVGEKLCRLHSFSHRLSYSQLPNLDDVAQYHQKTVYPRCTDQLVQRILIDAQCMRDEMRIQRE